MRFRRNESAELTRNASAGQWRGYAYQTDPVQSYADMALWYTKQMLESFADGICVYTSNPDHDVTDCQGNFLGPRKFLDICL